jgi:hypothetical protein
MDELASLKHRDALYKLQAPLPKTDDGISPTELHSTHDIVDKINNSELSKLPGEMYVFEALDEVKLDPIYKQRLLRKHKLGDVAQMPYLWECVEPTRPPQRVLEARRQLNSLNNKVENLRAKGKLQELKMLKLKKRVLASSSTVK